MEGHRLTMLGTGLIGLFYTRTLHARRGRDRVHVVYSRTVERLRLRGEAVEERPRRGEEGRRVGAHLAV